MNRLKTLNDIPLLPVRVEEDKDEFAISRIDIKQEAIKWTKQFKKNSQGYKSARDLCFKAKSIAQGMCYEDKLRMEEAKIDAFIKFFNINKVEI